MRTLIAATLLAAALPATAFAQGDPGSDKIFDIKTGNPAIAAASEQARTELPAFFAKVAAPPAGETYFLIKYDLIPEDAAEFIWAQVVSHSGDETVAKLVNNPRDPRFRRGQQVTIKDSQIIDWSYAKDGKVIIGAYTTRALLATMTPAEAAQVRQSHGW